MPTFALLPWMVAFQVTLMLLVPVTVAVYWTVPLGVTTADTGDTETEIACAEPEFWDEELDPVPPQELLRRAKMGIKPTDMN